MANFFINRPIFAIVISIIITLGGIISAFNLPVAQYPQITPPQVRVITTYPGANAEVVEQTVGEVIEQKVNGAEDMTYMQSTNSDAGLYVLTVQFELGKDGDLAAVQAQNRVAQAMPSLPQEVQQYGVRTIKTAAETALMFALYSPNNTYDRPFLKNYGSIYLVEDLKRIKGVGEIQEFGADYGMRIWLKPDKMAALGVTPTEVVQAITKQNIQTSAGTIGQSPTLPDQEFQYTARVKGRLTNAEEFERIIIRSNPDGSFIRVRDVARAELGSRDYNFTGDLNGKAAVGFAVRLTSDANALETIGKVREVLADSTKRFPPDMEYRIIVDNTEFVRESLKAVMKTFGEALLLVALVVFLFLQSFRATLIPMLAVPVSLIGTFAAFLALGFSINTLTLFAMVLAIGIVVDDAIVVIEAVEHHMRYSGLNPVDATKRAMSEVSGPVIAIAFVLAAVFIPVAFMGGTVGVLYKQFALTIAISMALSAFTALSLTPALCRLLLKPYNPNAHTGFVGQVFDKFNHWFETTVERYGNGLVKKVIPHAKLSVVLLAVIIILLGGLYRALPTSFVPSEDQGYFISTLSLPEASSMNRTRAVANEVAETMRSQPGVSSTMVLTGYDLLAGGAKPNVATMFTKLDPWDERKTPELKVDRQILNVLMHGSHVPEGTLMAFNPPALPGIGMVGGFTFMLQDRSGNTIDELERVTSEFMAAARQRPEIGMIYTTFKSNTPGYRFDIDRDKAEQLGVPISDVFSALQAFTGGMEVNDFNLFGRNYKVILQAEPQYRNDIEAIRYFFLRSKNGQMVPLNTLVKAESVNSPTVITRYNAARAVQINGSPAPGYSSGQAMAALEEVAAKILPAGYTYDWSGQSREEKLSGSKAPVLFGLSLIFVFLCLAALYESWSVPFAVLLTVPTGVFGAFLFQYARGLENSVYMQIGLIMLIGLAAKNAILIVEFAKVRVDRGMDPVAAAVEAAKIRLRPIIMTSLAFIIGCLPLALTSGAGAAARNAMGTAVVGGMTVATGLGIFLIPALFVLVEIFVAKFNAWRNTQQISG